MVLNHIILAMLWILYVVLHSLLASNRVKNRLRKMKGYNWYRLWYTLFAFIFFVVLIYYQVRLKTIKLFEVKAIFLIAGITILVLGLTLMFICIRKYFMNLSGLRSLVKEDFSNELQIRGVNQFVRHPLYLGTFAFIWGLFLLLPHLSLLIGNIIITVYTLIGIDIEEKKLVMEFGDSYKNYQSNVPKIIPFVRPGKQLKNSSS